MGNRNWRMWNHYNMEVQQGMVAIVLDKLQQFLYNIQDSGLCKAANISRWWVGRWRSYFRQLLIGIPRPISWIEVSVSWAHSHISLVWNSCKVVDVREKITNVMSVKISIFKSAESCFLKSDSIHKKNS